MKEGANLSKRVVLVGTLRVGGKDTSIGRIGKHDFRDLPSEVTDTTPDWAGFNDSLNPAGLHATTECAMFDTKW